MTAKTPAERKREQRQRDKLAEEERLSRLLSRSIKVDLYRATDMALIPAKPPRRAAPAPHHQEPNFA